MFNKVLGGFSCKKIVLFVFLFFTIFSFSFFDVKAEGVLKIGTEVITNGYTSETIEYKDKVLTLKNANIVLADAVTEGLVSSVDGLTIKLIGTNSIKYYKSCVYALSLANTTIEGSSDSSLSIGPTKEATSNLKCKGAILCSGSLNINNANITIVASNSSTTNFAIQVDQGELNINKSTIKTTTNGSGANLGISASTLIVDESNVDITTNGSNQANSSVNAKYLKINKSIFKTLTNNTDGGICGLNIDNTPNDKDYGLEVIDSNLTIKTNKTGSGSNNIALHTTSKNILLSKSSILTLDASGNNAKAFDSTNNNVIVFDTNSLAKIEVGTSSNNITNTYLSNNGSNELLNDLVVPNDYLTSKYINIETPTKLLVYIDDSQNPNVLDINYITTAKAVIKDVSLTKENNLVFGWLDELEKVYNKNDEIDINDNTVIVLKPNWKKIKTIVYNLNGGSFETTVIDKYLSIGKTLIDETIYLGFGSDLPTNINKEKHNFDGWYKEETFENKVETILDDSFFNDNEIINLYAKWNKINEPTNPKPPKEEIIENENVNKKEVIVKVEKIEEEIIEETSEEIETNVDIKEEVSIDSTEPKGEEEIVKKRINLKYYFPWLILLIIGYMTYKKLSKKDKE